MSSVPETFFAPTDDGWALALHRYPPRSGGRRQRLPLLLLHGMAASGVHFDLTPRLSLARAAAARGFDAFVVELRGAGQSRPPPGTRVAQIPWGFADYAERDVPTLVSAVLERTGAPALLAVGHSMGGMLLAATATAAPPEIRALCLVGAPLVSHLSLGARERRLMGLVSTLTPATHLTPTGQRWVPLRRLLGAAGRLAPLSARLSDALLLNPANCEPEVLARLARDAIHDVPVKLFVEITRHLAAPRDDGPYAFEARLDRIAVPTMVIAGAADRVASPTSVAALVARLTCPDLRFREMGLAAGDRIDYGHVDLLVGRHAATELYTPVLDFLEEVG